jgi:hypothetical protein
MCLQFIGAQPDIDTAVFLGPSCSGPCFKLAAKDPAPGASVILLSYPKSFDLELRLDESSDPAINEGIVSQVSETGIHAAATFSTGGW